MKDNLSYLLSTIDFIAEVESGKKKLVDCESEILKQQPKWQKHIEEGAKFLEESIKIFKAYDKSMELKYFWQMLKTKNVQFNEGIFKQLIEYALLAYDRGNWEDAYKMLYFISTFYPSHYVTYIYMGQVIQSLHGLEEASLFFKTITAVFPEPDLLFLAAENEFQREYLADAREYLKKAKDVLSNRGNLNEYDAGLKSRIEELLKALNS